MFSYEIELYNGVLLFSQELGEVVTINGVATKRCKDAMHLFILM